MAKNPMPSGRRGKAPKPSIANGGTSVRLGTQAPPKRGAPARKSGR